MDDNKKKIKLLIIGIIMNLGGTEKSFLSFASQLDYDRYDVDLLLARKEGALLEEIPPQIHVIELPDSQYADMFLMSGQNAARTLWNCFVRRNPLIGFEILPYFLKILFAPSKRSHTATRLWCRLLRHFSVLNKEYDVAAAYWGDRTMFYMIDKVKAGKKIAWLHFEYGNPPRDDALYLKYFSRCDQVVTVSEKVNQSLKQHFPTVAEKCVTIENINDPRLIWDRALKGESFPDAKFTGKRILTIARISEQKGLDFVVGALKKLREDGYNIRWYVVGGGDEDDVKRLKAMAVDEGVADMLILLGPTQNPYGYMRDCDIYAQPSRYEGKPITVEEAKMMFRPIVASNYVSASEQLCGDEPHGGSISIGRYGVITEIGVDGTYLGVRRLLDDEDLCDSLTMELSRGHFGNETEIEKFYRMAES